MSSRTINSYWSKIWVQQRIAPPDRQNIAGILREAGLSEYDEYRLLVLAGGRCANDDYYIEPIEESRLPRAIRRRLSIRVEEIAPLQDAHMLVLFRDGFCRKCNLNALLTTCTVVFFTYFVHLRLIKAIL